MPTYVALVSFPQKADAYQALSDLQSSPVSAVVSAAALVERDADGRITMPEGDDASAGSGFAVGSLVGLLVGVFGGPLGMLLGWGVGAATGGLMDADRADEQDSALLELSRTIRPGSNALVLETDEDDPAALDHFVDDHGGVIVRRLLDQVLNEIEAEDEAARAAQKAATEKLRAEHKAERKESREERLAKLKAKFS